MSKMDQLAATVAAQGAEIAALRAQLAAAQQPAPARQVILRASRKKACAFLSAATLASPTLRFRPQPNCVVSARSSMRRIPPSCSCRG
jgi:hypothetical protein